MNKRQLFEVQWYLHHGKYPERIVNAKSSGKYVMGDWSWNMFNTDKPEIIEPLIDKAMEEKP